MMSRVYVVEEMDARAKGIFGGEDTCRRDLVIRLSFLFAEKKGKIEDTEDDDDRRDQDERRFLVVVYNGDEGEKRRG